MTEHDPLQPATASQQEELQQAVKSYADGMTVEAARYLLGRGLTRETVATFRLGVVGGEHVPPGHSRYTGWLSIPYLVNGEPVRIRFRRPEWLGLDREKYGQPSGETLRTFNVDAIKAADDTIHVTEGEFDAMILNQIGLPAIALPGASSFRGYHGRMLAGFNRVWVWGDPDDAGQELVQKVTNRLPRSARGVKIRGGDISEVFLECGAKHIYSLIAE